MARAATLELVPAARARAIDLSFEPGEGPYVVLGIDLLLHELVANLVDNAISHGRARGSVAVRLGRDADLVVLEVEDDGPGIDPDERRRVFDRFYRAPGSQQGGSGLGLSIVRDICISHGAQIELGTLPSGRGLTVRVSFAAAAPPT